MKRLFYLSVGLILLFNIDAISQEKGTDSFTLVEDMPVYPGGDAALLRDIAKKVRYPPKCKANGIMGLVYITYTVNRIGRVQDVKVFRSTNELFNKEAIRVIKSLTGYKPGMQKGKPVPVQFTIPLRFVLTDDSPESIAKADKTIAIELYNLGAKEFSEKNYSLAKSLFGQALNKTSNWFHEAFIARGKTYMLTNEYHKALADFESALEIDSQLFEAQMEKGKTYILLGDKSNAIKCFENALQLDSISISALQYMGKLHYSRFEYDLALDYYERLIEVDQTQGLVFHSLGICYAKKRDIPKACEHMVTALELGINEARLFVENYCTDD